MKRSLIVVAFLALMGLAPSANGQWPPIVSPDGWNSALNRAMAGPNMVNGVWRVQQDPYGYQYGAGGYGIGGGRVGSVVGSAIGGAMIGGIVGGRNGALIGAGGGAGVGVLATASYRSGGHEQPIAGPGNNRDSREGKFVVTNSTRYPGALWFGKDGKKGKFVSNLTSGEGREVKAPKPGEHYTFFLAVPGWKGNTETVEAIARPNPEGWDFVEPQCVPRGGR